MPNESEKTDAAIIFAILHRRFGHHDVLRGVNSTVRAAREINTIVASQGGDAQDRALEASESTLRPDSGQIHYRRHRLVTKLGWVSRKRSARKKFGMLFQGGALFDS